MRIPVESDRSIDIETHLAEARNRMAVGDVDSALVHAFIAAQELATARAEWDFGHDNA